MKNGFSLGHSQVGLSFIIRQVPSASEQTLSQVLSEPGYLALHDTENNTIK